MRAITVKPGTAHSAQLEEVAEPDGHDGSVLAEVLHVGVCGTDREILAGKYGTAARGRERLVIGHESLARVLEAPKPLQSGDLVVGIVRRPDPVPCASCAIGEWDMCRNGRYTERGICERDGYAAQRIRLEPEFAVRMDPALEEVGVLLEPASVVAKAWEQIDRIGKRSGSWQPRTALVTGAGPIGLLAALIGVQRGLQVHVYDRHDRGTKPQLVRDLGAAYHVAHPGALDALQADIVVECTGASSVIIDAIGRLAPDGICCLAGVSSGGHRIAIDVGLLNRELVLENNVVFGSVNANRRHYEQAAAALARADRVWLARLISRRVGLADWQDAFERRDGDVKVVLDFTA
jgi:threonine dehydrogenase-like Zn-dependent dehydrogenase